MHASFLHALVHVLAKIGQIRENEVSKESGGYASHFLANLLTPAHKLVCMHTSFLGTLAYTLPQVDDATETWRTRWRALSH